MVGWSQILIQSIVEMIMGSVSGPGKAREVKRRDGMKEHAMVPHMAPTRSRRRPASKSYCMNSIISQWTPRLLGGCERRSGYAKRLGMRAQGLAGGAVQDSPPLAAEKK
jgi:hypothetical protein